MTGLILGIDIALISIPVVLIFKSNIVLQLLVSSICIIPVYLISLRILAKTFKKKGLVNNV